MPRLPVSTVLAVLGAAVLVLCAPGRAMAGDHGPGGGMRQGPLGPGGPGGFGQRPAGPTMPPPGRDIVVPSAPRPSGDQEDRDSLLISQRGTHYLVRDGQWYQQRGDDLVAIEPPTGAMVAKLPKGYTMRWIGGVPYFYAEGVYYVWRERPRQYEILQLPPAEEKAPARDAKPDAVHERDATSTVSGIP